MENIEKIKEDVEVGIETVSMDIPVRVSMLAVENASFEFTASIDDAGQIVLTPVDADMTFESANTEDTVDYDTPILEQETVEEVVTNSVRKETSILINATMLAESDSRAVSADVDEIGQCVIYPMSKENSFVTASIAGSLNLVTEEFAAVEYNGFKLVNAGDGWNVYCPQGTLMEEGIATLTEAKIFVCRSELARLKKLKNEECHYTLRDQTESTICELTNDYADMRGKLECDSIEEAQLCEELLKEHYTLITEQVEDKYVVSYEVSN